MCLIIAPGKDGKPALLPREAFNYAYSNNRDGFGAMWVEDGRVNHFKTLGLTPDEAYDQMEEHVERHPSVCFHLRMKTHGKIIPGLSHPFRILNKSRHGKDLFFMHNGVFSGFGNNLTYGQSDTTVFKDKILVPLLTRDPDALDDPEIWTQIEKMTSGSRLLFLDSEGKTYFTSPSSWNERYGLQLSNTYMLPAEPYTPSYSYSANDSYVASGEMYVTSGYIFLRTIDRAGEKKDYWCSCPKIGYVRTESGLLYRDNGPAKTIYHATNYIPKDNEFRHLGMQIVSPKVVTKPSTDYSFMDDKDDDKSFDDDEPPFDLSPSVDRSEAPPTKKGIAPADQQLRYARLVQNMLTGQVITRPQLIADLIGMNDEELEGFVCEDPQNTVTAFAELVEMVLEYNQALWELDPNHEKILNADEICKIGQADYHRYAMMEIAKARRDKYEEQIKKLHEIGDTPENEEVHVA